MSEKNDDFIIVFGALRSGTTLLRLMLDQHPQLSCPSETDFLFDFLSIDSNGITEIDVEALQRSRIYQDSGIVLHNRHTSKETILDMIMQLRQKSNQRVVLILHRGIEKALLLFPNVPILHMLRDPRDVARSSIGMGWAGTVYHGVEHWIETEREWDQIVKSLSDKRVETLNYEELISKPCEELDRICNFIEINFKNEMLDYDESSSYSKPDPSLIEQWRHKQNPRELSLVEGRLGSMLASRGYSPSGFPPSTPSQAQKLALYCRNKWAVWRTRISRYGVIDPLLVAFSRRLRIPSVGYHARIRIDEKVRVYRK